MKGIGEAGTVGSTPAIMNATVDALRVRHPPHIDRDWVGQEFAWAHCKEIWRLYQSGKFMHIFALPEDWRDESDVWPAPPGWHATSHDWPQQAHKP